MRNHRLEVAIIALVFALGCASAPPAPTGPIELDNTKWKLAISRGRLDGRTVVFKKEGTAYAGYLEDFGLQLRDVPGVRKGMRFFILERTGKENEYTGNYEALGVDGSMSARPLSVSVSGNTLTWSLEAGGWERVQ